ncbi:pilus assembly protein [Pseudomonas sp. SCB32]|uniref:pilus assembly protein n=1 Tax=Pseudomonas sp. SCB32 TaxID=2653853 RepID=UPI001263F9D7|nr:PilC/PilY family type IV pilus protein [Pseudomonas sp. SCB32]
MNMHRYGILLLAGLLGHAVPDASAMVETIQATGVEPAQIPLFVSPSMPPLNLLVVGWDRKLFLPAHNDASDRIGDGVPGHRYDPATTHYGYFDSGKCYRYASDDQMFVPVAFTGNKVCRSSSGRWSGDFLNYLTASRADAMRKVLYGGYRSTDTEDETVLERSFIPQGDLAWTQEYAGFADAGFDLADYTPFSAPAGARRTLFTNGSVLASGATYLSVLPDVADLHVWDWPARAGAEGAQARNIAPIDFVVRVRVCVPGLLEGNCKQYPSKHYKPVGLLQEYGEDEQMYFGLMMGSGVGEQPSGLLRKAISSFAGEVDANSGIFGVKGKGGAHAKQALIASLDALPVQSPAICTSTNSSTCPGEANPLGGIMLDALRYFSGAASHAAAYRSAEEGMNWGDPYGSSFAHRCSPPLLTVVSDASPSFDSQLPGSPFGSSGQVSGSLAQLDVSVLGRTLWDHEIGSGARRVAIGEVSSGATDAAPTAKLASSFGSLRGLPEEPTKEGTYNAASVAYYGNLNPITTTGLPVRTMVLALSSPLPGIRIPVGDGMVTLIPFGRVITPGGPAVPAQVSAYFVQSMHNLPGQKVSAQVNGGRPQVLLRVAFEGDAIVLYSAKVNADNTLSVTLSAAPVGAGRALHLGYSMAGTTRDGLYLEVSGADTLSDPSDTPPGHWPGACKSPGSKCPKLEANSSARTLVPDRRNQLTPLRNPLWYAAKWGGFDARRSPLPVDGEWDSHQSGIPDNYFQVTDAARLKAQLSRALEPILQSHTTITAPVVVQPTLGGEEFELYSTQFETGTWSGDLLKRVVPRAGSPATSRLQWTASEQLPRWSERKILMANASGTGLQDFTFEQLAGRSFAGAALQENLDASRVDFIKGDTRHEDIYRKRATLIGDIVNSTPVPGSKAGLLVGIAERLDGGNGSYRAFATAQALRDDQVYVGANDGMLHAFNAKTGAETFAYIPTPVIPNLLRLTERQYVSEAGHHHYFVDGPPAVSDVYFNHGWHRILVGTLGAGGRGIFALDISDPNAVSLLWEFTVQDDPELGYTLSAPVIARLHSGQWAVLLGNGYGGRDGKASLLLLDVADGRQLAKLTTSESGANGLSAVNAADVNGDGIADYAYAGDLRGNLWRFDLIDAGADDALSSTSAVSASRFAVSFGNKPLYHATGQAITAAPAFMRHPSGKGLMVHFGTGRYFSASDKVSDALQSVYGIWDRQTDGAAARATAHLSRDDLLAQTLETENLAGSRKVSQRPIDWTRDSGWVLDLQVGGRLRGERVIAAPKVRGNLLQVVTVTPNADPCSPGLEGNVLVIGAGTGGATPFPVFDLNGDGKVDDQDRVSGTLPSSVPVAAGGVTFSGDSLFDVGGKQLKLALGELSGRQTWTQMPETGK